MEEKTKKDYFLRFLLISFVIYLIIYYSMSTKIIEYKSFERTRLTEENIKKFENDIKEGKDVTLEDYTLSNYKDYSSKFSELGCTIGESIEKIMNIGIKKTLKTLSELFYE